MHSAHRFAFGKQVEPHRGLSRLGVAVLNRREDCEVLCLGSRDPVFEDWGGDAGARTISGPTWESSASNTARNIAFSDAAATAR